MLRFLFITIQKDANYTLKGRVATRTRVKLYFKFTFPSIRLYFKKANLYEIVRKELNLPKYFKIQERM